MALYFSERALTEVGPARTSYKIDRTLSITKVAGVSQTVSREVRSRPADIVNQTVRRAKGRSWQRLGDAKKGSLVRFTTQRLRLGALPILGIGGHTADETQSGEHLLWAVIGIADEVYQSYGVGNRQRWRGQVMLVGSRDGHSTLRNQFAPPPAEMSHRYPHSFPSSPESLSEVIGGLLDVGSEHIRDEMDYHQLRTPYETAADIADRIFRPPANPFGYRECSAHVWGYASHREESSTGSTLLIVRPILIEEQD